jgi:phosphonate transport system permease protein
MKKFQRFLFDGSVGAFVILYLLKLIFKPNKEFLLQTEILAFMALGACLFSGLLFAWVAKTFDVRTLGRIIFSEATDQGRKVLPWYKTFWGAEFLIVFICLLSAGLSSTKFSFFELFSEEGFAGAQRIFTSLMDPNWSILPQGVLAIFETIFIAFIATVFAIPISFLLAFFSAKNLMGKVWWTRLVYTSLRTLFNLARSIEPIIWAIIFSVWVGIGPFSGMLALMLHSIASLTKQYSEIIECVNDGPLEGIAATGASKVQVVWFAVVPQVVLPYVSYTIYRWDINVRMATIIGLVGGGGIGTMLMQYQGLAMWREVGCLVLLIALVVWLMDTASAHIREALK